MKNEYLMKICTYMILVNTTSMSMSTYSTFEILLFVMLTYFKCLLSLPSGVIFKLDMFDMAKVPLKLLFSRFLKASNREKYVLFQGT